VIPRIVAVASSTAVLALALTGCVANASVEPGASTITVTSTANTCDVSSPTALSGPVTFTITNAGSDVTEFYLLGDDRLRIVGEAENIGPGLERTLVVTLSPGTYFTTCKPGMVGDGIGTAEFSVTDSGVAISTGSDAEQIAAAEANYVAYVKSQVETLMAGTSTFLDAYRANNDDAARALYARTRATYERIEPVAESFGDLDPKIDFREADVPAGTEWTGWHRIEKDLWPPAPADNGGTTYVPMTSAERARMADLLEADTAALYAAVSADDYSVSIDAISNGAIGLLDEVASGKITGEEEIWSHTDLWDFQGNLEGARVAYEGVRDLVETKDAELVERIDTEFDALAALLADYGNLDDGFVYYDQLTPDQVRELADGVNALAEPLSTLTGVLLG
jgi:iron uptake system component EfeO